MAKDKGEHINSEPTVYTVAVAFLHGLAPIGTTKIPVELYDIQTCSKT